MSKCLIFLIFYFFTLISIAYPDHHPTRYNRRQTPSIFNHSWLGVSGGIKKTYFSNPDLKPGFQAQSIKDLIGAFRITVGHYFNPYLGLSLNLMRGGSSSKFYNVTGNDNNETTTVRESLFGVALRPTWPLGKIVALYAEGGLGFIVRSGFSVNSTSVIDDKTFFTTIFGAGAYFKLPHHLFIDVNGLYSPKNNKGKRPNMYYGGLGLNYMLIDDHSYPKGPFYWFPLNYIHLSFFNENWFYGDIAKYTTEPTSIPIFFDGHIKLSKGLHLIYERNYFHIDKRFSLEWGGSIGYWQSQINHQNFITLSLFPELKFWIVRSARFDFYFTYSLAGPTYISARYIGNLDSGSYFTFQDFLGFGAFLGSKKQFNINLKIVHYSNGNTIAKNPGICAPIMFGIGLSF